MPKKPLTLNLPKADELFTTQEERDEASRERVIELPLSEISDFPNHPFKMKVDADMTEMVESVKSYGVLVPGLVRLKDGGGYEMVAGHRRKKASELAERITMPCIIRDLTDDEAVIIMVDSNLQRERILPSEKAFAYKMKLDALKRQGHRTDLTSAPAGPKSRANEEVAQSSGESVTQIKRYIRLTELVPEVLDLVDEGQIAMRPAVELSYLSREHQQILLGVIEYEDHAPTYAQAVKMRKFSEEQNLNKEVISSIMQEEKDNPSKHFKLPRERIRKFFSSDTPAKEIEETIIKALELWKRSKK